MGAGAGQRRRMRRRHGHDAASQFSANRLSLETNLVHQCRMSGDGSPAQLRRRALLGAFVALAAPAPVRAQADAGPRLGVILPGADRAAGMLARRAAEIGGELLARRGKPVSLRFTEAWGGADQVARSTARLVDEGAELLVVACSDATTEAALSVAERRAVPLIAATAIAPGLGDRGSRLLIRTGPTASQLVGRGLGLLRDLYAAASLGLPERLAIIHAGSADGRLVQRSVAAILPASGLTVSSHSEIAISPDGVTDRARRAELATALRLAAPDLVLLATPTAATASVLATIASAGVRIAGIASFGIAGLAAREIATLPGGVGDCHVTFSPWPDPAGAVTADVRALYERDGPPLPFAFAQGALGLVVDAVLLAGETAARHPASRGEGLAAALRGSVLVQKMMRGPPMRFDARGQNTAMPSVALQNRDGRPVVVLPREGAEAAPVWPNPALFKS